MLKSLVDTIVASLPPRRPDSRRDGRTHTAQLVARQVVGAARRAELIRLVDAHERVALRPVGRVVVVRRESMFKSKAH